MRLERFGELDAVILGQGNGPVVVLLHGYGAPGDDLLPVAEMLDLPGVRFVVPAAPLELESGLGAGRAWWPIDLDQIQEALAAGRERDLSADLPPGVPAAHAQVMALLDDVERRLEVDGRRVVLGGFSQGAMLACDVALRSARPLGGLVLLSGTLLAAEQWIAGMPARRGLKVLQSHGRRDPLLPFRAAERLRDHLRAAGLAVDWLEFGGGHEIPFQVMERMATFIAGLLPA